MREYLLITVSGEDRPGITHGLVKTIAQGPYPIVDMGQSVTHGFLSLSLIVDFGPKKEKASSAHPFDTAPSTLKDVLFLGKKFGLDVNFKIFEKEGRDRSELYPSCTGEKYILTVVSKEHIPTPMLEVISAKLVEYQMNILRLDNVSDCSFRCLEITTTPKATVDMEQLKRELLTISLEDGVDMAFISESTFRRAKRLVVLDMDSTLIQAEILDELAKVKGVEKEVSQITEQAMEGKIDFDESFRRRLKLLKGLGLDDFKALLGRIPITNGAEDFLNTLKERGHKIALISGGPEYFTEAFKERFQLDYAFGNQMEFTQGKLTGEAKGQIINGEQKALLLDVLAQQEKISLEDVMAIGDGANDLPMLSKAGLGVAFHAKEVVRKKASHHLNHGPMTSLLYFLGIPVKDS